MIAIPRVPPPIDWDRITQAIAGLVVLGTVLLIVGAAPIVHTQMIGEPLTEFALYNPTESPSFSPSGGRRRADRGPTQRRQQRRSARDVRSEGDRFCSLNRTNISY